MQTQRTFLDELKHQYKSGGIVVKLIFVNLIAFLLISIINALVRLSLGQSSLTVLELIGDIFYLQTSPAAFIRHPWGLFTHMFAHIEFFHILSNMIFLWFSGKIFLMFFSQKRLLYTYLLGGLFGGFFELIAQLFPGLTPHPVIGASGAVMAVMVAIAAHKPSFKVNLFGVLPVPMFLIAGVFFLKDFVNIGMDDGIAHFAHLGGATLGLISVQQLSSPSNIITLGQQFGEWFMRLFKKNSKPKMKKTKGNNRMKTDEQYNEENSDRQAQVDTILDKISKSGYESLTRKEKDFLFKQSNNGK